MSESLPITQIKNDLEFLQSYWVVVYGSYLSEFYIPSRSDIDITIITQTNNKETNLETWSQILGQLPQHYDVKIFELLPLYLQINIIKSFKVIFGNHLEISEYFYHYRKLWKDMKFRVQANQFEGIEEKIHLLDR